MSEPERSDPFSSICWRTNDTNNETHCIMLCAPCTTVYCFCKKPLVKRFSILSKRVPVGCDALVKSLTLCTGSEPQYPSQLSYSPYRSLPATPFPEPTSFLKQMNNEKDVFRFIYIKFVRYDFLVRIWNNFLMYLTASFLLYLLWFYYFVQFWYIWLLFLLVIIASLWKILHFLQLKNRLQPILTVSE